MRQGGDTMKNIETTSKKNPIRTAGKTTQPKKPVSSKTCLLYTSPSPRDS